MKLKFITVSLSALGAEYNCFKSCVLGDAGYLNDKYC